MGLQEIAKEVVQENTQIDKNNIEQTGVIESGKEDEYDQVLAEMGLTKNEEVNIAVRDMVLKIIDYLKKKGDMKKELRRLLQEGKDSNLSTLENLYQKVILEGHFGDSTTEQRGEEDTKPANQQVQRVVVEIVARDKGYGASVQPSGKRNN